MIINDSLIVDGIKPDIIKIPNNVQEFSSIIEDANINKTGIVVFGGKTRLNFGNIPTKYTLALGTTKLNKIIDYDPRDLTIVVESGITIKSLNETLKKDELSSWCYPPNSETATLGGTLASNTFDPFRSQFGGLRENIIGAKFIRGDGKIIKSGGKVVKNVQGFDLHRIHVGALGTLGTISEVSLKLTPLPKNFCTISCEFENLKSFKLTYEKILAANILPDILSVHVGKGSSFLHHPHNYLIKKFQKKYRLICVISGTKLSVERRKNKLTVLIDKKSSGNINFEETFIPEFNDNSYLSEEILIRTSIKTTDAIKVITEINNIKEDSFNISTVFHSHFGTLFVEIKQINSINKDIEILKNLIQKIINLLSHNNSSPVIENCSLELKKVFDVFGDLNSDFFIMKNLKKVFDPNNLLNPGRFIGRL
jgi:glycolate oxidase FAD binding subunit